MKLPKYIHKLLTSSPRHAPTKQTNKRNKRLPATHTATPSLWPTTPDREWKGSKEMEKRGLTIEGTLIAMEMMMVVVIVI